jgi:hypothetical protein
MYDKTSSKNVQAFETPATDFVEASYTVCKDKLAQVLIESRLGNGK